MKKTDDESKLFTIRKRLEMLSQHMTIVANAMVAEIGDDEAKQHAEELAGAAQMVWQWSVKLQENVQK
ncbi:hypothetical protein VN12_19620 [Pirellula sp. SH-Sr6A]|uniref:hypothetical protein n=1 Tax=Pirellula sp. SH-Sr6A TaxID=1632865 RepID=UPI00078B99D3|nr:hypothetical protein [Pirellula sp. SH-Sr6A]AMV34344.1 hypothetical protein VN12_19620 [Pirellula sp. SH-Sr6A]